MEGKRASGDIDAKKSKRAKTDFPTEIVLEGIEYINLSRLLKTAPFATYFAKHYKKSEKYFIEEEQLKAFNVPIQNVADGVFVEKQTPYSPANDLRLVTKDGKITDFIERVQSESHPMAPPIVVDGDLAFTDTLGIAHDVEMRGVRTEEGIYFKVKDIGRIFDILNLVNDMQHKHTQLEEDKDYVWFTIPDNERKKHGLSRELFFTHSGMIAAVFISRSPVAKQFRKWVSQIVFVHRYGTQDQKKKLAKSLLNKETIDELTKCCVNGIGGLYLLETMITPPKDHTGVKKKVYKYGYTKNVQQRMQKHVHTYGRDSVIHALVLLPIKYVSTAEAKLKHILSDNYIHEEGKNTELLLLSHQELTIVRESMRVVGETFYGETFVHAHQLEMLQQSRDHAIEMLKKDHELEVEKLKKDVEVTVEVAKNNAELAKKDGEVAKRDIVILGMKNDVQARRIKELEDELWRYKKNNANAASN
jgi:prophage antirepressor-like protein